MPFGGQVGDDVLQRQVGGRDTLLQQTLFTPWRRADRTRHLSCVALTFNNRSMAALQKHITVSKLTTIYEVNYPPPIFYKYSPPMRYGLSSALIRISPLTP